MRVHIVRGSRNGPSSRCLRDELQARGHRITIGYERGDADYTINWSGSPRSYADLNPHSTTNKFEELCCLREASIPVPAHSESHARGWYGRSRYHSMGKDFTLRSRRQNVWDYWVEPISGVVKEWRVHMGFEQNWGTVIRLGWKVNKHPEKNIVVRGEQIRSRRFGWHLTHFPYCAILEHEVPFHTLNTIRNLGAWSLVARNLDLAAIDMVEDRSGKIWVLEVNTCPGLKDPSGVRAYVDYIERRMGA